MNTSEEKGRHVLVSDVNTIVLYIQLFLECSLHPNYKILGQFYQYDDDMVVVITLDKQI